MGLAGLWWAHGCTFLVGGVLAWRAGRAGVPLGFALGSLWLYTWFTPVLLWWRGEGSIAGLAYAAHLPEMLGVYGVGVGVFVATWAALPTATETRWVRQVWDGVRPGRLWALLGLYLGLFLTGLWVQGIPLAAWFSPGRSDTVLNLFGYHWKVPLVDKALDGLITLGYLLPASHALGWLALPLCLVLFALAGFRYRTLLLVGGLLLAALLRTQTRGQRLVALGLCAVAATGMAWLTLNRLNVSARLYKKWDYNLAQFDARLLANETNNSQTFGVLLGHYHAWGGRPDGWGASPHFVAVRALPKALWPGGQKPVAPLLGNIRAAYDATPAGAQLHPAVSNLEEYYLGYGMWGVVLGMAALAWLCRQLARLGPLMPLGTFFLWQLISRGYLPQQVDLAVFLALPVGLLYLWQRYGSSAPLLPRRHG